VSQSPPDIDRVTAILDEVIAEEVLPRFRQLRAEEIERKNPDDPDDLVTVVDRRVEERLTAALAGLAPGVPMVGEESCHTSPERVGLLAEDAAWLLDPIDGTRNFAHGDDGFGVMLAYVAGGELRAGWIVLPVLGHTYVAEAGSGTLRDGVRVQSPTPPAGAPRGTVYMRFMSPTLAAGVTRASEGRYRPAALEGCSAVEYTALVDGAKEFVVYHRLHPWDHAPGVIILQEAGGHAEHLDGSPYTVRSRDRVLVLGSTPAIAAGLRDWLKAGGAE
jgi:fructose-1,6-bisphosphatase/inositol monophosphatase family enzyme